MQRSAHGLLLPYSGWNSPNYYLPILIESTIVYEVLWRKNDPSVYSIFLRLNVASLSIFLTISMPNIQTSFIFVFHYFHPLQLRSAIQPHPHSCRIQVVMKKCNSNRFFPENCNFVVETSINMTILTSWRVEPIFIYSVCQQRIQLFLLTSISCTSFSNNSIWEALENCIMRI